MFIALTSVMIKTYYNSNLMISIIKNNLFTFLPYLFGFIASEEPSLKLDFG